MSDYFDRIERQLVRRVEAGAPRRSRLARPVDLIVVGLSIVVVVAVGVVFLSVRGPRSTGSPKRGGIGLVYRADRTPQNSVVTGAALARAVDVMRERAATFGMSGASFSTTGAREITATLPGVTNLARAEHLLGTTARLEFYDWEKNVLLPGGNTVASGLTGLPPGYQSNPNLLSADQKLALRISEGGGRPGSGSTSLYDAVKLASEQPVSVSPNNARQGPQYYMFGTPGSPACRIAERHRGIAATVPSGFHCLLSGPDTTLPDLYSGVPAGVSRSQGQVLRVPQGTVVLQATSSFSFTPSPIWLPTAQFYVLKDDVALFGNDTTNPRQSTDPSGAPDVAFGFTSEGNTAFQNVTTQIARRGQQVSGLGPQLNQHFAVALDTQLVTVPQIDFKRYPNGIVGGSGADITGGFTIHSARDLAILLRLGALPVQLRLVSANRIPAH